MYRQGFDLVFCAHQDNEYFADAQAGLFPISTATIRKAQSRRWRGRWGVPDIPFKGRYWGHKAKKTPPLTVPAPVAFRLFSLLYRLFRPFNRKFFIHNEYRRTASYVTVAKIGLDVALKKINRLLRRLVNSGHFLRVWDRNFGGDGCRFLQLIF